MSVKTASSQTKILLSLTVQQKELITELAKAKGLSLSAYLRLKALEDVEMLAIKSTNSQTKIQNYLNKKLDIPKKYQDYKQFKKHNV